MSQARRRCAGDGHQQRSARSIARLPPSQTGCTSSRRIARVLEGAGQIDILFNCAGFVASGTVLDCTDEQWEAVAESQVSTSSFVWYAPYCRRWSRAARDPSSTCRRWPVHSRASAIAVLRTSKAAVDRPHEVHRGGFHLPVAFAVTPFAPAPWRHPRFLNASRPLAITSQHAGLHFSSPMGRCGAKHPTGSGAGRLYLASG